MGDSTGSTAYGTAAKTRLHVVDVLRDPRSVGTVRVAHFQCMLRAHRGARTRDVRQEVGRSNAAQTEGMDDRENRTLDDHALRKRREKR